MKSSPQVNEGWTTGKLDDMCICRIFPNMKGRDRKHELRRIACRRKKNTSQSRLSNKKTNKNKPLITMYLNFLRLHCLKYWLRNVSCEGPPGFQWLLFTNVYGWIGIILFDPTITGSIFITSAMSWHTLHHPLLWAVSVSIFTRSYVYYHTSQCFCGQRKVMLWRGQ